MEDPSIQEEHKAVVHKDAPMEDASADGEILGEKESEPASTLWTPTLSPASSDVDTNFSDLHALQSPEFWEQASSPIGELSPTIRGFGATSGHLRRLGDSWSIREGFPDFSLVSTSVKNPEEGVIGGFLGLPKESFTATFDPFGVFLRGKYPTHNVPIGTWRQCLDAMIQPWLREVGVAERRPVRTSRDVTSWQSSRPRHRKDLYFPHRHLWTMEYSCKDWCKPCRRRLIPRQHSRLSWRLRLKYQLRTLVDLLPWRDSRGCYHPLLRGREIRCWLKAG
ncbi:hypothetical protein Taro_037601 [Colocasia esculenta]|uniref:Uncharacterized protein n=1 Tax=Colocasia esculenta TaxID=4460 RepID=A0A843WBJ0_COLES|nr:hypothetical protein [Colocasia esculenta]